MLIREGEKKDLSQVINLIRELADYEKGLEEVTISAEMMEEDGFGQHPFFGFYVAEKNSRIIGISIYYYRYSTWKGKKLYLEDIIVTEKERGNGVGKLLFDRTILKAREEGCKGLAWQVLDWNEPAINFYKKYDHVHFDKEWINCELSEDQINKF